MFLLVPVSWIEGKFEKEMHFVTMKRTLMTSSGKNMKRYHLLKISELLYTSYYFSAHYSNTFQFCGIFLDFLHYFARTLLKYVSWQCKIESIYEV